MKRALVLLADGFEEVEAITPIDFLRRAGIETTAAGVTGREVTGAHDIRVKADAELADVTGEFDAVVVPGGTGGAERIAASDDAVRLIRSFLAEGKLVAAICAAPGVVLGAHGLIGDRAFTAYPGFERRATSGRFVEERVVVDGNLITSRGPGTAAEFALAIIEYLAGRPAAQELRSRTLQP